MTVHSRRTSSAERLRRRVYLATTLGCVLVLMLVGYYDYQSGNPQKVTASVMSGALGLMAAVLISNRRISLRTIEYAVAIIMFVGSLSEWSNIVREQQATTRPYLTFMLLLSVWFGLLPPRVATGLSVVTYLGYCLLILRYPHPDWGALFYLGFASVVVGIMSAFGRQIAREREEAATFQQQALTDALTGLPNRRAALARLQALWANADSRYSFAVLLVDIDHFKQVNDTYGHAVGDEVLREFGQTLLGLVSAQDPVARWGDEEFLVLLAYTDARHAYALADTIHGKRFELNRLPSVTVSAGGALSHEANTLDDLIHLADQRLYFAKQNGRNQVRWDLLVTG